MLLACRHLRRCHFWDDMRFGASIEKVCKAVTSPTVPVKLAKRRFRCRANEDLDIPRQRAAGLGC